MPLIVLTFFPKIAIAEPNTRNIAENIYKVGFERQVAVLKPFPVGFYDKTMPTTKLTTKIASTYVKMPNNDITNLIRQKNIFGESELSALLEIIKRESSFNMYAINPISGACGLFQALPCAKIGVPLSDLNGQITWGMNYIKNRYRTPSNALYHHNLYGWY